MIKWNEIVGTIRIYDTLLEPTKKSLRPGLEEAIDKHTDEVIKDKNNPALVKRALIGDLEIVKPDSHEKWDEMYIKLKQSVRQVEGLAYSEMLIDKYKETYINCLLGIKQ